MISTNGLNSEGKDRDEDDADECDGGDDDDGDDDDVSRLEIQFKIRAQIRLLSRGEMTLD